MVKSPKIRHSKQRTEPVTIDLSADEVTRPGNETGAGKDSKAASAESKQKVPEDRSEAATRAEPAAATTGAQADKGATTGAAGGTPTSSGSGSAFGREPGAKAPPKPEQSKRPASETPAAGRRGGRAGAFAAGLGGGVIALAGAAGLYAAGYLPAVSQPTAPLPDDSAVEQLQSELTAMREEIAALKSTPPASADTGEPGAALAETNARVENMAVMMEDLRGDIERLSAAVETGDGGDGLAALATRLDEIEKNVAGISDSGGASEALSAELARIAGELRSLRQSVELDATDQADRITAAEKSLAVLTTRVDEAAEKPGVALAIAASALKAAIDRGQPFAAELETFAQLSPEAPEIAELRQLAATGVPTAATIAAETDAAAVRMIEAARPDSANAGLLDRLWASAESLITVRPIGAVEGEDVPAIVARIEAAIKNGNYPGAIAEYESLPDAPRAAGADFIAKVKARQAADALVGKALDAALRA